MSPGLSGYRFNSESYLKKRSMMIAAWRAGDFDQVVQSFQRSWTDGPHRTRDQVDPAVRERVRAMASNGIEHAVERRMLNPPAIERLDELELPMLVVVGELDDPGILEIGSMLVAADPNAELVTVPGVAHMVNLEAPERFNELLLGFLDRF